MLRLSASTVAGIWHLWAFLLLPTLPNPSLSRSENPQSGYCRGLSWCFFPLLFVSSRRTGAQYPGADGSDGVWHHNRESSQIQNCELYVDDADGVRWSVERTESIAPLETVTFLWSSFTAQGQPMPAHIGRDRGVHVSCFVSESNKRLTAAFE
jgi:hypothetical protein